MKRFLRLYFFLATLTFSRVLCAQGGLNIDSLMNALPDMGENIYLSVYLPDSPGYSANVGNLFTRNIQRCITNHGMINGGENSRFFVSMDYVILSKDIVPGPPARISQEVQFNFVLADAVEQKAFSSVACTARGIGINEEKAIITALQKIRWDDKGFDKFFEEGKQGIVAYYTQRGPEILIEAQQLDQERKYDEALALLTSVPSLCPQYKDCMRMALCVYQNKIDNEAATLINKARGAWAMSQDKEGAKSAIEYIEAIPVGSNHEQEVTILLDEISSRVKEINDQEWALKLEELRMKREAQQAKMYRRTSSGGGGGGGLFSSLRDSWNDQPTWKKVMIGAGIGLGAAAIGTGAIASSVLSRSSFHFIRMF